VRRPEADRDGARIARLPPQSAHALRGWLRGTRARLTLTYAAVFAIIAGIAAAAFYVYFARLEAGTIDDSLAAQAQAVTAGLDSNNGRVSFQGGDTLPGQTSEGIAVDALLVDAQGTILDRSGQAPPEAAVDAAVRSALTTDQPMVTTIAVGGVDQRVRAQKVTTTAGPPVVLVVSRSMAEEESTVRRMAILLVGVVAALTAIASVLGYAVAGRALRPVREIAATAHDISEHDLHRRIELDLPPDELGELAATFNAMLSRLESAFGVLQRFTADAAHELRAPLAVMRAEVDVSLRQPRRGAEYRKTLDGLRAEIERLSRLADHLLVLARADAGELRPGMEPLDVPDFLEERVDQWRPLAAAHDIQVRTDLPDVGQLRADRELLRGLVDNLLDNAVKHTPSGGTISVTAVREGDWWRVEVADTGPGVPPELRATLFERFSRGDPARSRDTGGAGLGLALCAAIAHAHGGTIALADGPGARFVVRLPAG
jgi:two-component system OmpR family sensor kinase